MHLESKKYNISTFKIVKKRALISEKRYFSVIERSIMEGKRQIGGWIKIDTSLPLATSINRIPLR